MGLRLYVQAFRRFSAGLRILVSALISSLDARNTFLLFGFKLFRAANKAQYTKAMRINHLNNFVKKY